ncbi:MAG: hypothetical protein WC055_17100, partial [Melioribacteraceae bacterium]
MKFFALMLVFFAIVLSIPISHYILGDTLINNHIKLYGFLLGASVVLLICCIDLLLRNSELKSKLKKEAFLSNVSVQTVNDYEEQIKCQESQIIDIKQAFSDAVEEIKYASNQIENYIMKIGRIENHNSVLSDELKIAYERIEALSHGNKVLLESRNYWKERASHQKHTKKVVESELWECINSEYWPKFKVDEKYSY